MALKILYETTVKNEYADDGITTSSQGKSLLIKPTLSQEVGHNPGELLAFSWATCLEATLRYVCHIKNLKPKTYTTVTYMMQTDEGPPKGYQFIYEAVLHMNIEDETVRQALLEETHLRCPISKLLKSSNIRLMTQEIK